jgi:hypothetical protein
MIDFVLTQSILTTIFPVMPGGKRPGAGRPRAPTVKKMYKLEPETIEHVKTIALGFQCTESAIAEQALRWYIPTKLEQARRRIAKNAQ